MATLMGIFVIGVVSVGYLMYQIANQPKKYKLFFDVDGTITKISGAKPNSLYEIYMTDQINNIEKYSLILFGKELDLVRSFFHNLVKNPNIEIILVTNNFKEAVEPVFTKVLNIDWNKIDARSAFRNESVGRKMTYITERLNGWDSNSVGLYFDDDEINFVGKVKPENLTIVNCSNGNWLGKILVDLNYTGGSIERLLKIWTKRY
jgi:hypothetical protein